MNVQFKNAVTYYRKLILDELNEAGVVCWVAGGSVRDYFQSKRDVFDHDLFFPNLSEYEKAFSYFKGKGALVVFESENGCKVKIDGKTFDLVKKVFASPQKTIDCFDFTVSMFAVDREKVYHGDTSFIDLAKRQLMVNALPFPASSVRRVLKYYEKGFKMCNEELGKLIVAVQKDTDFAEAARVAESEETSFSMFRGID